MSTPAPPLAPTLPPTRSPALVGRGATAPGAPGAPAGTAPLTEEPDLEAAERAVADLLRALRLDTSAPGLTGTPGRVARAYAELLAPQDFTFTTFPNDEGYDELVVVSDIPFRSLCEHHLLPFTGTAHVGYLPADRVVGLSKLARAVQALASRPQVQERLTCQVADLLESALAPRGVGVVLEADHTCMSLRGARAAGARTRTSALRGRVRSDARTRGEFLDLTGRAR